MSDISVYDLLRDQLVAGGFKPGQRLKPEDMRQEFGCSASTLREMLFRLSTVGLVDFQEQRGFRMPPLSRALRDDLIRFRILLECEGACLSIRNGTIEWEARLTAAHHKLSHIESRLRRLPDSHEWIALWSRAELEFHQTLIEACASDTLKSTHSVIYFQFRQQMIASDREFLFLPENIEQHQAILDAALDHDEARIRGRITAHLGRNLKEPVLSGMAQSA